MRKSIFTTLLGIACMTIMPVLFSCSDDNGPSAPQEPENHNKVLAGQWSLGTRMEEGQWVVDENGHAVALQLHHDMILSWPDICADSSRVELVKEFNLDYNPYLQTITITLGDSVAETSVVTMDSAAIRIAYPTTQDTVKLKKQGIYGPDAPANIDGLYMSAKNFISHGMRFEAEGKAMQNFYYPEMVDNLISKHSYIQGVGNKGRLSYHVKYRLNPEKVREETGSKKFNTDITYELTGELYLTFLTHVVEKKYGTEYYLGQMDGPVTAVVTDNQTGETTTTVVDGPRYFALSTYEEY